MTRIGFTQPREACPVCGKDVSRSNSTNKLGQHDHLKFDITPPGPDGRQECSGSRVTLDVAKQRASEGVELANRDGAVHPQMVAHTVGDLHELAKSWGLADRWEQATQSESPFDALMQTDKDGNEFWSARELYPHTGYNTWDKFQNLIIREYANCTKYKVDGALFVQVEGIISRAGKKSAGRPPIGDWHLNRRAAYHVFMAADSDKEEIKVAHEYFVDRTILVEDTIKAHKVLTAEERVTAFEAFSKELRQGFKEIMGDD